jgi:hypothetical protein
MAALPDLVANARVFFEQGEITVGCGGSQDLDLAAILEPAETLDEVPVEALMKVVVEGAIPVAPIESQGQERISGFSERILVTVGDINFHPQVSIEAPQECRVFELGHEDRRKTDVDPGRSAFIGQALEHPEKRKVGFSRRLVKPVHAMRPAPMVQDVGDVAVENEREVPIGHFFP